MRISPRKQLIYLTYNTILYRLWDVIKECKDDSLLESLVYNISFATNLTEGK